MIVKRKLSNTIWNVLTKDNTRYICDNQKKDIKELKIIIDFALQTQYKFGKQTITMSVEPAIVYKTKKIADMWLRDYAGGLNEKLMIYPLEVFCGSHDLWKAGKDKVYKTICNGQYGTYDGSWIEKKEEK